VASPIDVYRAEIQLKNAEDSLALAKEAMETSEDRLKSLLALPLNTEIALSDPLELVKNNLPETEAIDLALNTRIELEQMEDDLENAVSVVKVARNNTLPDLNLSMGYTRFKTSERFDRSLGLNKNIWSVQFTTSTDLFRKSEKAAFKKRLIEYERAKTASSQVEDSIIQQVRVRLRALKKAEKQIGFRQEQISQAMGKLELAQVKFNYGMADNFNLIEAETELQKGRSDLILATIDYLVGTYEFRAVLGTLIERIEMPDENIFTSD
ncbi:MAG: TolC family protein, partial [Nitrospinota bacterium]